MQQRRIAAGIGVMLGMCLGLPTVWAADESIAEASTISFSDMDRSQVVQSIEATRQSDPELAAEMEQQLRLLDSGDLNLRDLGVEGARAAGESFGGPQSGPRELTAGLPGATPTSIPVFESGGELTTTGGGRGGGEYLPPEAKRELQELFQQGTGDPSSQKDRELHEKANEILEKYGVEARGFEGHEGDGAGVPERAWEQMAPEAREQMERLYGGGHEGEASGRETFGREMEFHGAEQEGRASERMNDVPTREHEMSGREVETATREFEAPTREYEAATREYEAPAREQEAPTREYEAPTREYEAPTREYETPTHEYEAPSHEFEGSGIDSTPEHAYEGPGPSSPDAQPPQP